MAPEIPAGTDRIERAVCDALIRRDRYWWHGGKTDAAWTRAVKDTIGSIGERLGNQVYACSSKFERNGEWVFDLVWCKMNGEFVVDVPLALESEWTAKSAIDDFQKLLISRARHRVMVLWAQRRPRAEQIVASLIRQVAKYRGSQPGDRYLFCCWIENPPELLFQSHVVRSAAV